MIDLIIPYYNNPSGLLRTLDSINHDIFYITIVDDYSDQPIPSCINADRIIRLNFNVGPGNARQWGMDYSYNPYIMFLDTGDIFISKKVQTKLEKTINYHPEVNMFAWTYYFDKELSSYQDNRMHGKVYKRDFINKYGISFCPYCSYLNEDIGFNHICRGILAANEENIHYIDQPIIKWIRDENSLTQKDGRVSLYRDQVRALALNIIHVINTFNTIGLESSTELHQMAIAIYYWFIRTAAECPEYLPEAWSGAKIFYNTFKNNINKDELFVGNEYLRNCLKYADRINFHVNILQFYNDILTNEIIPNKYLT